MKYVFLLIATVALVLIATSAASPPKKQISPSIVSPIRAHITNAKGREVTLTLEIAASSADRERGLMYRKSLKPYDGMAFFFPRVAHQKFWMKNTPLPLDILFIDANQQIVAIIEGKPFSETAFGPDTPVETVIELDAGRARTEDITVGNKVHYELQVSPTALAR